jgi:hypothetical protein
MRSRLYLTVFTLWVITISLATSGCDESVNPILGTEEAFSFYGYFDLRSDMQAIRVFSIDGILTPDVDQKLDAVVTSINSRTGETQVWRDSTVTYRDGTIGHVFYAHFRPDHDTEYTFQAVRSDGVTTAAKLKTPSDGLPELVNITSARSNVIVDLRWTNVPRVHQTIATYTVRIPFPDRSDTTTVRVRIPSGQAERTGAGSWKVSIIPSLDIGTIYTALFLQPIINPIFLDEIEVSVFVVSEEWESPVGVFDPELLVQPGVFSNVEGGFGFIGGGYFDSFIFDLTDRDKLNAGFSLP